MFYATQVHSSWPDAGWLEKAETKRILSLNEIQKRTTSCSGIPGPGMLLSLATSSTAGLGVCCRATEVVTTSEGALVVLLLPAYTLGDGVSSPFPLWQGWFRYRTHLGQCIRLVRSLTPQLTFANSEGRVKFWQTTILACREGGEGGRGVLQGEVLHRTAFWVCSPQQQTLEPALRQSPPE